MTTYNADMQQRRDTAANWTSNNPTLKAGELGVETDTGKFKIGDGATAWTSLGYVDANLDADLIPNTPSGNLAATDVQGALDELQTDVDTRLDGAAHDARDHSTALGTAGVGDLSDVDTTTGAPAVGDAMVWDGSNWVPDSGTYVAADDVAAPKHIHPPVSQWGTTGGASWPLAERVIAHYFHLPIAATFRYVNLYIATSSGNIQVGTAKLSGANLLTYTRVMNSGIVASPGTGSRRIDCGATVHEPGDYAVFVYADNTTFQTLIGASSAIQNARLAPFINAATGGVGASGAFGAWSTNYIAGLSVEGDV